jgi:hypothetical protein
VRAEEREKQQERAAPSRSKPTISRGRRPVNTLRIEEENQWQLSDADGENEYSAMLEGGLSYGRYAMFTLDDENKLRVVLLERFYKFKRTRKSAPLPAKLVERKLKSEAVALPAWLSKKMLDDGEHQAEMLKNQAASGKMITVKGNRLREVDLEANDLDFEEEFADDDEVVVLFEGSEEEEKFAKVRWRSLSRDSMG